MICIPGIQYSLCCLLFVRLLFVRLPREAQALPSLRQVAIARNLQNHLRLRRNLPIGGAPEHPVSSLAQQQVQLRPLQGTQLLKQTEAETA